ncbi:TPA: hypothetical protein ACGOW9_001850 [Streptococcus suis]
MFVKSTVTFDMGVIQKLEKAQILALEQTTEFLHTEIVQAQVVPFDQGTLQGDAMAPDYSNASVGQTSIVHSTAYARRLYYHPEYEFQTTTNPNAKGKWFEDWLPGGNKADVASKAYGKLYKKISGV